MDGVARIETTGALDRFLAEIGPGPLALDTEADSFHHYRDKVCLIQLSVGGRDALLDPLAEVDVRRLGPVLSDRSRTKVLHGADYDVRILRRDFDLALSGIFDTMIAARLLGESALGLASLLQAHLGVQHDKSQQRADWSRRPLSEAMIAYAVADTRHLADLAALLTEKLAAAERTPWAEEEFARLETLAWRDAREGDPEPFRRVKGSARLDRAGLAILREAWAWRDGMARRRDRPTFRVLRDEVLMDVVRTVPRSVADLGRIRGFPEPILRSPSAHDLVEAVVRGAACAEGERPEVREVVRPPVDPAVEAAVSRLKEVRDRVASELSLPPEVVASRGLLERLGRRVVSGEDPWAEGDLRRWQRGLLEPRL